ncbi:energy-coupling factor ABC transporter permease [Alistipes sp.]|uniref:energy-coupling factor ABC transporter permease n=1 Tax=Alistipes sp. TaxID=1872444 RepID=UPI003AEF32F6
MSDALVSPPVFILTGAVSLALLGTAVWKVKRERNDRPANGREREHLLPLMGVMGAFIFAAQMINFSIPGTGSSGHLVGGILLAAILGPWAGLLTLASVLVIQCLLFADGGFMALGCNILNMAVLSCLVAYPLVFRPLMKPNASAARILTASLLASVVSLELGAAAVTLETELSDITALPTGRFLLFMLPIHLVIGIGEGLATAAVIGVVQRYKPELLAEAATQPAPGRRKLGKALAVIALAALLIGGSFSWLASSKPDGLEWSIEKVTGGTDLEAAEEGLHGTSARIQQTTALMPDYDTSLAGIIGSGAILAAVFGASYLMRAGQKQP